MSYDSQTAIANRHDFDVTYTNEFDNNQTAANLITPSSGKTLKITGLQINVEGTASSGYVRVYFADDENDQVNTIGIVYTGSGENEFSMNPVVIRGDQNASLKVTATLGASQNYFIGVNYKEE